MSATRFAHPARGILTITTALVAAALALPATGLARADTAGALTARLAGMPTLTRGAGYAFVSGSPQVRRLQRWLRREGERPGPLDGLFGPLTERAVIRFQRAQGLAPDGIAGPNTLRHLVSRGRRVHGGQAARTTAPRHPGRGVTPATTAATPAASPATPAASPSAAPATPAASPASRRVHTAPARAARPGSDATPFALIPVVAIALSLAAAALLHRRRIRVRRGNLLSSVNAAPARVEAAYAGVYRAVPIAGIAGAPPGDGAVASADVERPAPPRVGEPPADAQDSAPAGTRGAADLPVAGVGDASGEAPVAGVGDASGEAPVAGVGDAPADAERSVVVGTAVGDPLVSQPPARNGPALAASVPVPVHEPLQSAHARTAVLVIDARPPAALDDPDPDSEETGAPPPWHPVPGGVQLAAQKPRRPKQERVRSHVRRG